MGILFNKLHNLMILLASRTMRVLRIFVTVYSGCAVGMNGQSVQQNTPYHDPCRAIQILSLR